VKHATPVALDALAALLDDLRTIDGLTERKRGVFYRGSSAFLHFHEDPAGFFADAKLTTAWVRFDVTTAAQRRALVREVRAFMRRTPQPRAAVRRRSQPRAAVPR
jgi:hypothetical protein